MLSVMEGEATALWIGLTWLADLGVQHAVFETDSKSLVDRLSSRMIDHNEFGDLLEHL